MSEVHKFLASWDEHSIRDLITHYDQQTEVEQAAENEAALGYDGVKMVAVPVE